VATGDYLNDTPFHILAMYGHMDLLLELIEQADKEERLLELLDAQTVDGLTPADTAIKWGYKALHSKLVSIANNKRMVQVVEQLAKGWAWKIHPITITLTLDSRRIPSPLATPLPIVCRLAGDKHPEATPCRKNGP
jgi:ankyrin repeat protein